MGKYRQQIKDLLDPRHGQKLITSLQQEVDAVVLVKMPETQRYQDWREGLH